MRTRKPVTVMALLSALPMMTTTVAQATTSRPLPIRERLEAAFAGIEIPDPKGRCSEPALVLRYVGEGTISHLGRVTFASSHCSYVTSTGELTGRYGEAEMVIEAANGDQVHATYSGRQIDETRYLEFMTITGGTGRFSEARGALVEIVTLDLATFNVSIRGWGWIVK